VVVVKRLVALNQPTPPLERSRVVVRDRAQSCQAEGFYRQQLKRLENCAQRRDGWLTVKSILVSILAAVLVVGCATTQSPAPPTTKVQVLGSDREGELDVPILAAAYNGNIEAVKQHLPAGANVNAA